MHLKNLFILAALLSLPVHAMDEENDPDVQFLINTNEVPNEVQYYTKQFSQTYNASKTNKISPKFLRLMVEKGKKLRFEDLVERGLVRIENGTVHMNYCYPEGHALTEITQVYAFQTFSENSYDQDIVIEENSLWRQRDLEKRKEFLQGYMQ